ncbi:MAG: hypothetical protein K2H86_00465 [Muribaculaceae bacterium]|nr:hypothetical protein [Muribaculaceae bacterium]
MNITKENFNQYVAIATDLAVAELYDEATLIGKEALEAWQSWDEEADPDVFNVGQLIRIITFSEWRSMVDSPEDHALLAEILNCNSYWSDSIIEENKNFNGSWILREKALAYYMLFGSSSDKVGEIYLERAQKYLKEAIEILERMPNEEKGTEEVELCNDCKIHLVQFQRAISNKLARNTAISLFGEELNEDQKENLMGIYQEATDVLFNEYFNKKGIAVVQNSEVEDENVKDDVLNCLLEVYSEKGNDDPYWWAFTKKESPDERKKIRFVKNIEDASDNNFDEIPWVFTLDLYPFDIEFNQGEEPVEDAVYEIDSVNTDKYNRIS